MQRVNQDDLKWFWPENQKWAWGPGSVLVYYNERDNDEGDRDVLSCKLASLHKH